MRVRLPMLRADQMHIAAHPAKHKVVCNGRRYGKTVTGGVCCMNVLRQHGRVAWIAPIYKNTRPLWRFVKWSCQSSEKAGLIDISESERTISTYRGGLLAIYSADNIDGIRGENFHLVVVDEAAKVVDDDWYEAIMPTVADTDGDTIRIGTPNGKHNHFCRQAAGCPGYVWNGKAFVPMDRSGELDTQRAFWSAPSMANPMPGIQRFCEEARRNLPENCYRQEILAEFLDDDGVVFRNVRSRMKGELAEPRQNMLYVAGVDLARTTDYTVVIVMEAVTRHVVAFERMNSLSWAAQVQHVAAVLRKYNAIAFVDKTGVGDPVFEQLSNQGISAQPYQFTKDTKRKLVEHLVMAFDKEMISYPATLTTLADELEQYEATVGIGGTTRYSAPEGGHDDCVMALALANYAAHLYGVPTK